MPNYDYVCESCAHSFEELQKITADPLKMCPECKKETLKRKTGGGIGLSFSGSGFYATDYSQSSAPKGGCCPCGKGASCEK